MRLCIPASVASALRAQLAAAYPEEGCGLLLGRDGERREVTALAPTANAHAGARATRYLIAPEDFLAAERAARAAGIEVLGFYHSHPDAPPAPSAFDLERAWAYYSYVIVEVAKGVPRELQSFRLRADATGFEPERVEIVAAGS